MLKFYACVFSLFILLASPAFIALRVDAQEELMMEGEMMEEDSMMVNETNEQADDVNSFELFWPMVAGKSRGESLYSLKLFKEKIRGWLIFRPDLKANYEVFLGTKRVLEAEKLLNEAKTDFALITLDEAKGHFDTAISALNKARESDPGASVDPQALERLQNVDRLTKWLITKNEGAVHSKLETTESSLKELLSLNY